MVTQEYLKQLFDYQDGQLIRKIGRSRLGKIGEKAGGLDKVSGYYRLGIKGKGYLLHRMIFLHQNGFLPEFIDHINGLPTDNRIENLRVATKKQNCQNRIKHRNNTSSFKNVSWHKVHNKWGVSVYLNNKKKHFGYFEDLELADLVAQEVRSKYHRQFARN